MDGTRDLELIFRSRTPIIVIESRDEARILELLQSIAVRSASDTYTPLFRWTITDGLQRIDIELEPQAINSEPTGVLKHIRAVKKPGIYVLLDFHPFPHDPVHIRLLKDICMKYRDIARQIVLISHEVNVPSELEAYCARFDMALPSDRERARIIEQAVSEYDKEHPGSHVQIDQKAHRLLIRNLAGLTYADTQRLARNAIYFDGAITKSDLPGVMQAKYELLNRGGARCSSNTILLVSAMSAEWCDSRNGWRNDGPFFGVTPARHIWTHRKAFSCLAYKVAARAWRPKRRRQYSESRYCDSTSVRFTTSTTAKRNVNSVNR